ncbi:extensin-like protein [Antarctobacter heliothermus]|uniref:Extensin-like protein n=1 Tax=Antarctobacter heliothermus TaxID=74033 RepID=A0A222E0W1_9RHOB|nr:extensin family protein [Antarctobacter heliothermus]ASP19857.1 extensin-like protein [Antarctobacter heliothermus]
MKHLALGLCCLVMLGSCGARERVSNGLDKIGNAFAGSDGGGLCGDPALQGEVVGAVPGKLSACGIEDAVRLQSVGNVRLSQGALMDCKTARALEVWVREGAKPAVGRRGGGVSGLKVAAHYSCRTRNNQPGAPISEHGRGKAIDISAILLKDGSSITVEDGWDRRKDGKALRRMHKEACGVFGTVLGPESDRFHRDHFHFDTRRHGNGAYCR